MLTALAGADRARLWSSSSLPWLSAWLGAGAGLPPPSEWQVWAGLLFLVLLTAAAAGLYPSLVVSSIRPAEVFRPRPAGAGGSLVRTPLVTFQFTISIALS